MAVVTCEPDEIDPLACPCGQNCDYNLDEDCCGSTRDCEHPVGAAPMRLVIVGVDPGVTTGLTRLTFTSGAKPEYRLAQTDPDTALELVGYWLDQAIDPDTRTMLAVEKFVVSGRSGRSGTAEAGAITRELIGRLTSLAVGAGVDMACRPAGAVKPWATDTRIAAAGITIPPKMRDAADAVRHSLFCARHDCGVPDPLSKKGKP